MESMKRGREVRVLARQCKLNHDDISFTTPGLPGGTLKQRGRRLSIRFVKKMVGDGEYTRPDFSKWFQDEEAPQVPPFLGYFDVSATGFAWREPRPEQIERRRAAMDDVLIFDVLLTSGGIHQPVELFPPHDVDDLVRLLEAIDGSHYDILKRECLVYWLLKWHQDGREERFRNDRCLPPQFTALADAYWHLDTGVNVAVSLIHWFYDACS